MTDAQLTWATLLMCIALFFSVHSCGPTEHEAALDVAADVADAQAAALIAAGARK